MTGRDTQLPAQAEGDRDQLRVFTDRGVSQAVRRLIVDGRAQYLEELGFRKDGHLAVTVHAAEAMADARTGIPSTLVRGEGAHGLRRIPCAAIEISAEQLRRQ